MDVRDDDGFAPFGRRPANPAPDRDPHAGRFSLKRPEHEFPGAQEIEARPVDLRQPSIEDRRDVRRVGDRIAFPLEEALDLAQDQGVVDYAGISFGRSA